MIGGLVKTARREKRIGGRLYLWCTKHKEFHPSDKFARRHDAADGYSGICYKGNSEYKAERAKKIAHLPWYLK